MISEHVLFKTSTIADGNMSFRFGEEHSVIKNRKRFLDSHSIPFENHTCMRCNHGEHIVYIDKPSPDTMPDAEVLITQEKNLALMLLTADCLPTAFYDPMQKAIALAHLNRKTIAHNLGQKTVGFLTKHFGTNPADLLVSVGPHINAKSYAFQLPLHEPIPKQLENHTYTKKGLVHFDLKSAEQAQLAEAGVLQENMTFSEIDTRTSPHHFSHYESSRDDTKPSGRLATLLMMVTQQ